MPARTAYAPGEAPRRMRYGSQRGMYEQLDIVDYNNRGKLEMCLGDALAGLGREATSDWELMKELKEDLYEI